MLDVRRLRLLVELSERGTISAVADALHFTPSTVSHALSSLEQEIGVALLERTPRSVRLTPAGDALVAEGRKIIASLNAACTDARAVGGLDRGRITIATFPSAGSTLVAAAVARLQERHTRMQIRLIDAEPEESLRALQAGEVDVAVVYEYGFAPPIRTDLALTLLCEDPMQLCPPADRGSAGGDALPLATLRTSAFVAGRPGSPCHDFTVAACARAGFEPRIAYETDDIAFTCALVRGGFAAAIIAESLLATAPAPVMTYAPTPPLPPRKILAAHRPSAARLMSVVAALDALKEAASSNTRWLTAA